VCTALHCTALHCTALHCTLRPGLSGPPDLESLDGADSYDPGDKSALHCTVLHTTLYCTALHTTLQHCTALYCILHCIALHCTAHCAALHCTALHTALPNPGAKSDPAGGGGMFQQSRCRLGRSTGSRRSAVQCSAVQCSAVHGLHTEHCAHCALGYNVCRYLFVEKQRRLCGLKCDNNSIKTAE
jgi:hypothetical protein